MSIADRSTYLSGLSNELARRWPDNRTINIVCHGHSVPSGYACTPFVDTFSAYPHRLHRLLKARYPFAVINVIVTAIGGENSAQGAARFERDVLTHRPDLITIDYGLNDRRIGLDAASEAWRSMITAAQRRDIPVILLTPSWDQGYYAQGDDWAQLIAHADQIRALAAEYGVGLADSFEAYRRAVESGVSLNNLLSHINHPSAAGHQLIADEIAAWFVPR